MEAEAGSMAGAEVEPDPVLIQVRVPDIGLEKCLQFPQEERVYDVKQQILAAMPKDLDDSFNYGLFQPPLNGRAGKFLDEERRLSEYPFQGTVGQLELKFKRRVYKMLNMDEKQLKSINSRSNLKKFLDHVMSNNVEKVNKMCNKGLDPNFHCQDSGETPLSLISGIRSKPGRMVMTLVNGGAILDFRTKDGSTAMHRAVATNNVEAVRTMLELGASPNYRDSRSLTPLYQSCATVSSDPAITETLLHDHAVIGAQDLQGWQEVHQVCRSGMVHHLQHLLLYGADRNARNASGNTPLHVCAVNNKDDCAKMLLYRGADKECLNFAGQTAYQVAVIAGNLELAEVIQSHKEDDVVPCKDVPKYNPKRRVSAAPLSRTMSDCSGQYDTLRRMESPLTSSGYLLKPASPSLSDRSLPPFSSGSSISETSTGSGSTSTSQEEEHLDSASTLAASLAVTSDLHSDILSLSSGVGTSSNSGSGGSAATPTSEAVILLPGMTVVAVESFSHPGDPAYLSLVQGDVIEVTGSTDTGLLEGRLRGQTGLFPREVCEEVRLRSGSASGVRRQEMTLIPSKHFGTTVRSGKIGLSIGHPRSCVLHKGKKGFGFVLRGAKAASPLMDMIPSDRCPSLQYMDDVDPGGVADMAGVNKGDFLLAINNEDVTQASHERVVTLIRHSGELVRLTVVTVTPEILGANGSSSSLPHPQRHFSTLPRKPPGSATVRSPLQHPPPPPKRDPNTTLSVGRARAKSMVANMAAMDALDAAIKDNDKRGFGATASEVTNNNKSSVEGGPKIRSVAQELELIFKREAGLTAGAVSKDNPTNSAVQNIISNSANSSPALGGKKKVYASVAQMKKIKSGSVDQGSLHKDYHSTPDLQTPKPTENGHQDPLIPDPTHVNGGSLPRRIYSQEDLHLVHLSPQDSSKSQAKSDIHPDGYFTLPHRRSGAASGDSDHRTITRIRPLQARSQSEDTPSSGPAPLHPPPPPPEPPGQVVSVTRGPASGDYARLGVSHEAPVSSFNPASSARLYEQPREVGNIVYKASNTQNGDQGSKKKSPTRTHSLPPRPTRPMVLKRIEDPEATETYSVNGVNYTTYTTFRSPITPDECDSVSQRMFPEDDAAETPTTPTNGGPDIPHIPEPDYDMSDLETNNENGDTQSFSGSETGSWRDATATLRRNSKNTTERKKKKTVSFIMNEELANIIHSSGTMTKRDSILKDSTRERENADDLKSRGRTNKRSPTKVAPPMASEVSAMEANNFSVSSEALSGAGCGKAVSHPAWEGGSIVVDQSSPALSDSKLASSSKIRIEVGNKAPGNGGSSTLPRSQSLHKSQSLSSELSPVTGQKLNKFHPKVETSSGSSGGMISQADLQKAKMHLKSSRSFPELLEDGDNSSSGVSSDQDQDMVIPCEHVTQETQASDFVTKLTVSSQQQQPIRDKSRGPATNQKPGDTVTMTGPIGPVNIEWCGQGEEEHHYQNYASMMRQRRHRNLSSEGSLGDHVNVRRPFPPASEELMSRSYHGGLDIRQRDSGTRDMMSQSVMAGTEIKTIEHSLALIRNHVKGMEDVPAYCGVPPPPQSEPAPSPLVCPAPATSGYLALAPPPGFSDSESNHSMSDTDSLGSEPGSFNRFGFSRVSKPRTVGMGVTAADRIMPQAQYTGGARKSASGILDSAPVDDDYMLVSAQKEFRAKNLLNWNVGDVGDWLDSLFLSEYKASFLQNSITGYRLATLSPSDWDRLGVGKNSHRLNLQKSIKRYLPKQ